jgi:predicted Zn-dependent protease
MPKETHMPITDLPARITQAQAALYCGQTAEAETQARALLALAPDHPAALVCAGEIFLQCYHILDARDVLERAVALAPDVFAVRWLRGLYFLRVGQPQAAIAEWEQAVRLAPSPEAGRAVYVQLHQARKRLGQSAPHHPPLPTLGWLRACRDFFTAVAR